MKPYIRCHWCGYKTKTPAKIVDHMFLSGHGLTDSMRKHAIETDLVRQFEISFHLSQQEPAGRM
jgi:hypothetical protein